MLVSCSTCSVLILFKLIQEDCLRVETREACLRRTCVPFPEDRSPTRNRRCTRKLGKVPPLQPRLAKRSSVYSFWAIRRANGIGERHTGEMTPLHSIFVCIGPSIEGACH